MNILFVAPHLPFFDRSSGDLRFFKILKSALPGNRIWLCTLFDRSNIEKIGPAENIRYRRALEDMGVQVHAAGPREVLHNVAIDVVFFEFYFTALQWLDVVRLLSPSARVIVDSVDVHFRRLEAKARLTNQPTDAAHASQVKVDEISVYRRADVVIAVTDDDAKLLTSDATATRITIIPNIHVIHKPVALSVKPMLSFVGGFAHDPNADAVLYFCKEIFPIIRSAVPDVVFKVIGNDPPPEVLALSDESIKILGYVADTTPHLRATLVSVAPLRYGAGMKGKVGEAMSLGLPVVTTSVGAEGFGLSPGMNVLIGDTPALFADMVIRLIQDHELRKRIGLGGHRLMREKYSEPVVAQQVVELFQSLTSQSAKSLPRFKRLTRRAAMLLNDHVMWRFRRNA